MLIWRLADILWYSLFLPSYPVSYTHLKVQAKGLPVISAKKIVFACDAGMGSSAMGATKFRNRIKTIRPDLIVTNTSVDNIPADCDIAVVQVILAERAEHSAPQAKLITISNFLTDPALDELYFQLSTGCLLYTSRCV